jgi:hypothetical protein
MLPDLAPRALVLVSAPMLDVQPAKARDAVAASISLFFIPFLRLARLRKANKRSGRRFPDRPIG